MLPIPGIELGKLEVVFTNCLTVICPSEDKHRRETEAAFNSFLSPAPCAGPGFTPTCSQVPSRLLQAGLSCLLCLNAPLGLASGSICPGAGHA